MESLREQAVQERSDGTGLAGHLVCQPNLAENLRFSHDHGVQAAGDAEKMLDGIPLLEGVEVRFDLIQGVLVIMGQKLHQCGRDICFGADGACEDFDPITG